MTLEDLIISKTKISEGLIEKTLRGNVKLVEESLEVYLLPETKDLQNNSRILLYLTGKKAWSLLKNKEILTPIVELSNNLGIKGNTLRPILKELRDQQLVESKEGKYHILPMGISRLEKILEDYNKEPPDKAGVRQTVKKRKSGRKAKRSVSDTGVISGLLQKLINQGFFNQPRGLSEIQKELKKNAVNVALTTLPSYVIQLIRNDVLFREKQRKGNRMVWVYSSIKKDGQEDKT